MALVSGQREQLGNAGVKLEGVLGYCLLPGSFMVSNNIFFLVFSAINIVDVTDQFSQTAVSRKLFLSQFVIFTFCASNFPLRSSSGGQVVGGPSE